MHPVIPFERNEVFFISSWLILITSTLPPLDLLNFFLGMRIILNPRLHSKVGFYTQVADQCKTHRIKVPSDTLVNTSLNMTKSTT